MRRPFASRPAGSAPASDEELVARFLAEGSEAAFRQLFRRHTPRLLQLGARLQGGAVDDAEDAVQETWIRAADGLRGFRWQSSLATWLAGVLVNVCREQRRARRGGGGPFDDGVGAGAATAEAPAGLARDLEAAIAALPEGYRQVLVLHDVEGHTHEQTARLLGIEAGTSKSQLHRARRALRQRLGPQPER